MGELLALLLAQLGAIGGRLLINPLARPPAVGDGPIDFASDDVFLQINKGSAAVATVAAPGAAFIGRVIDIVSLTAASHTVQFTGGTLRGGSAAGVTTWTSGGQIGARLRVRAISATVWQLEISIGGAITG